MLHNLRGRAIYARNVSCTGARCKSFNIQWRAFAGGMMKQQNIPVVKIGSAEIIEVDGMKLDMTLKEVNVMSSYVDTYKPILQELRNNLNEVNNQYVQKSISLSIGKYTWKNKASHTAETKITELANDIEEVCEKLNQFCNRVNNVSNDNFDKLFDNIHRLSHKCRNEVITKKRIIDALNEQQELVVHMKQDVNAIQIRLKETQKELKNATNLYDKLNEKYELNNVQIQEDTAEMNTMNKEMEKGYQKYKKGISIGFFVCSVMTLTTAALFYYFYEQEMKGKQGTTQLYEQELQNVQRSMKEMENMYMVQKMELNESEQIKKQFENSLIETEEILKNKEDMLKHNEDMLMQQTQKIEQLKEELNVASNRGLWYYIFG
eukprot:68_1